MSVDMAGRETRRALPERVAEIVALEERIEAALDGAVRAAGGYPRVAEALRRFHDLAKRQRDALRGHLEEMGGAGRSDGGARGASPSANHAGGAAGVGADPVSGALRAAYALLAEACIGYAGLHVAAHVSDSTRYGSTLKIAEQHLRGYAEAAQEINQLIADAVSWDLRQQGQRCECQCPSCAAGMCLCVTQTTDMVNAAWRETTPAPPDGAGVYVVPSAGCPEGADLRVGDRVTAVQGRAVANIQDIQNAVKERAAGESVRVTVRREAAGDVAEVTLRRR